ncbi:MAG: hypothetical protein ACK4VY_03470 [Brevundimonas sp.]
MSRTARRVLLIAGIALAGCSERVIVRAAPDVLVTVEAIEAGEPLATARVHYLFAEPPPLAEGDADRVARMRYDAVFDCAANTWGQRAQDLTLVDGRTLSETYPAPAMETPSPGSLGDGLVRGVCDPAYRKDHASRRPLASIEKDYLAAMVPAARGG